MTQVFFGGFVVGALLVACAFVMFMNRASRRPRREIPEWEDDFFEPVPPNVTTRIINRHREFTL